jgi:hypothetical protein
MVIKSISNSLYSISRSLLHVELCSLRSDQQVTLQRLKLMQVGVHVRSGQRSAWRVGLQRREAMKALVQGQQVGHSAWVQGLRPGRIRGRKAPLMALLEIQVPRFDKTALVAWECHHNHCP